MAKRLTQKQIGKVVALHTEGKSNREIARIYGVNASTIGRVLDRQGVETQQNATQKKEELEQSMEEFLESRAHAAQDIIKLSLQALSDPEKLKKATVNQIATMMGIVIDKFRSPDGKRSEESLEKVKEILNGVEDGFNSKTT